MSARAAWLATLLVAGLGAQERLSVEGPDPATIRLGDTAVVLLRIEGRGADPKVPQLPQVPGLRLELSPPTRSTQTFYDGRTLVERTGVSYQLRLRPEREGSFVVPPFPLWTGTREQQVRELRLDVRKDLRGEELGWLAVQIEPRRVYVHEPVRIRVEFGIQQGLRLVTDVYDRYRYLDLEVQAPWLNEFPGGERIDLPAPQGDLRLIVGNRQLFQANYQAEFERQGQRWQRFSFERAFLPTRLGKIELSAPLLRYHVLLREGQQDLFGLRRGQQSENFYAYGQPLEIEVLPIPEAGRPTPYYGAVGRFTLDAALDRDSTKVGSSVKLTLTVRGQGNLEFLRLPPLDDLPGFHKLGETQAERSAEKVVVTYDLTPLSAGVREVPPIAWNYFDTTPGTERFVAVTTSALPLRVQPLANGETLAPLPEAAAAPVAAGVDDVHDLPALDGAPLRRADLPGWLVWLAALGPWLLVAAARFAARRYRQRAADVTGQRARGAAKACRQRLAAGADPLEALLGYLADRLGVAPAAVIGHDLAGRLQAAGLAEPLAGDAAAAVEQGVAARYGGGRGLDAAAVAALVARLEPQRFGARLLPLWFGLLAAALPAAPAAAQDPPAPPAPAAAPADPAAAVAAYRAGDFRAAAQQFAAAYAQSGDRRLLRALGNCHFRLGDLPRALWAYECARLGAPRDPELLANLRLLRQRLDLPAPAGFQAELDELRARLRPGEAALGLALLMGGAAAALLLGWRRPGWRWLGALALLPASWLGAELLWLGPSRPPVGIALQPLAVTAEPRADLPAVANVRPGAALPVLGRDDGNWLAVQAGERRGFVPRAAVLRVE